MWRQCHGRVVLLVWIGLLVLGAALHGIGRTRFDGTSEFASACFGRIALLTGVLSRMNFHVTSQRLRYSYCGVEIHPATNGKYELAYGRWTIPHSAFLFLLDRQRQMLPLNVKRHSQWQCGILPRPWTCLMWLPRPARSPKCSRGSSGKPRRGPLPSRLLSSSCKSFTQ
jgi:hypothetical protein